MAKDLFDRILDSIFDANWVGKHGEKLTARELSLVKLLGRKGKTLRNVYVPKGDGETSEIDVMYITKKGIIVFESKNYSGWIFGDEDGQYWTVSLPNRQKCRFYNPIKQNKTHMKWLGKYVGERVPLFSVIVFSERCELKKVSVNNPDVRVIKRDRTYATVRDIWEHHEDVLSDDEVDSLYIKLKELTNVDAAVKAAHIQNIEKKYKAEKDLGKTVEDNSRSLYKCHEDNDKQWIPIMEIGSVEVGVQNDHSGNAEKQTAKEQAPEQKICPRCGKVLVLRTARNGKNAGNQFYGCTGFPKCRYTESV